MGKKSLSEYRFAFWADDAGCPVDDELVDAAEAVATALEKAGAKVDRKARPHGLDISQNVKLWITLNEANQAAKAAKKGKELGGKVTLTDYRKAQDQRELLRTSWEAFFDDFDFLICPSYPCPAFKKQEVEPDFVKRRLKWTKHGKELEVP